MSYVVINPEKKHENCSVDDEVAELSSILMKLCRLDTPEEGRVRRKRKRSDGSEKISVQPKKRKMVYGFHLIINPENGKKNCVFCSIAYLGWKTVDEVAEQTGCPQGLVRLPYIILLFAKLNLLLSPTESWPKEGRVYVVLLFRANEPGHCVVGLGGALFDPQNERTIKAQHVKEYLHEQKIQECWYFSVSGIHKRALSHLKHILSPSGRLRILLPEQTGSRARKT